jgi:hypothetical protein
MNALSLLGSVMGLAFVSGLNLYATVLTVGLGVRLELLALPPNLADLEILAHPAVITAAAVAYCCEFFADKIPWVDTLWDACHSLIRPLGAAFLGASALGTVDPSLQLAVLLLCGGVALTSHTTKASLRLVVNQSPEPFSNTGVSLTEDAVVVAGTWLAVKHPVVMLGWTVLFITLAAMLLPPLMRLLRVEFLALAALVRSLSPKSRPVAEETLFDEIPGALKPHIPDNLSDTDDTFCVRAVSGEGLAPGCYYVGLLYLSGGHLLFVTRRRFRVVRSEIPLAGVSSAAFEKRRLLDRLVLTYSDRTVSLLLWKSRGTRGEQIARMLRARLAPPQGDASCSRADSLIMGQSP